MNVMYSLWVKKMLVYKVNINLDEMNCKLYQENSVPLLSFQHLRQWYLIMFTHQYCECLSSNVKINIAAVAPVVGASSCHIASVNVGKISNIDTCCLLSPYLLMYSWHYTQQLSYQCVKDLPITYISYFCNRSLYQTFQVLKHSTLKGRVQGS